MAEEQIEGVIDIVGEAASVTSVDRLSRLLRQLKRRGTPDGGRGPTHRQIAARTGWSPASVTYYLTGAVLAPVDRFDLLVRLLGATAAEREALVAARDRVEEQRRLRGGPTGGSPRADPAVGTTRGDPTAIPRSLPPPPSAFVGREPHLADLDRALAEQRDTVLISAVSGMGGVGKTALALHWAHRSRDRFPDGQLYVNLRGFDPHEPLRVGEALRQLLVALGVAPADVPREVEERVDRYRTLIANRRMLVVLDNASGVEQVRPLVPPPPSVALVTSRDRLDELVTVDGAHRLVLDVLTDGEATRLLRTLVGPRCDHEPWAVRSLIVLCGHLPLALRVAAELAHARPSIALSALVEEMLAGHRRTDLDAFTTGDARSEVRAVFSWSLRSLPAPAAHVFRRLGLAPGETIDPFVAAALADVPAPEAAAALDVLVRAHLVQPLGNGRYGRHDLLRRYAEELAEREIGPHDRHRAHQRVLDYYLGAAATVVQRLFPGRVDRPRCYPEPVVAVELPEFSTVEAANAWLLSERGALVRLGAAAARWGFPAHALCLALVLRPFLDSGYDQDALAMHRAALAAVADLGDACDRADRANVYTCLGVSTMRLGRLDEAEAYLRRAMDEHRESGDAQGEVVNLSALAYVRRKRGRLHESLQCQQRGLQIARAAGLRPREAIQLLNVGVAHLDLEQYAEAETHCRAALEIFDSGEPTPTVAYARLGLATALVSLDRYDEAYERATDALEVACTLGLVEEQAAAHETLAMLSRRLGQLDEAMVYLEDGLRLARELGRGAMTATLLNTMGEAHREAGAPARARDCHAEALVLASSRNQDRREEARAHLGLGDALAALGDVTAAGEHWRQALTAYCDMRLPTADAVRARLARLA